MRKLTIMLVIVLLAFSGCKLLNNNQYDVVVVGTDPEGITAALAAARAGAKTLLIDSREKVGGLFTLGWLNFLDMNYNDKKQLLTQGIFKEFYDKIEGVSFNINTAEKVFMKMIKKQNNLHLILNADSIVPKLDNNVVVGVTAHVNKKDVLFNAKQIIDCTQNGDIAALAGADYFLGHEDIGGPATGMAVTQVFKLGGIKDEGWQRLKHYLNNDNDQHSGFYQNSAWGFGRFYDEYIPTQKNCKLRGLNIARQTDGCVLINALQIFNINPLDSSSINLAKEQALKELEYIIPYLKKEVPGMENISLIGIAPELYIRESRHFKTEYMLSINDVLEHKSFSDKIALASYPVDLQGTNPEDAQVVGNPIQYSIPFRCLVPLKIENLQIASRCSGYSSLAHGSTRMVPIGMCVGEAAGNAAAMAINNNIGIRDVVKSDNLIKQLQQTLVINNAYLPDFYCKAEITENPYYEGVKLLRNYGLMSGSYNNDYKLNDETQVQEFYETVNSLIEKDNWKLSKLKATKKYGNITLKKHYIKKSLAKEPELIKHLSNQKVWRSLKDQKPVTKGEFAQIIYHCREYVKEYY